MKEEVVKRANKPSRRLVYWLKLTRDGSPHCWQTTEPTGNSWSPLNG